MPETFGTGVPFSQWDPRCNPAIFARNILSPGDNGSASAGTTQELALLTELDIVSFGGHTGGALFVATGTVSSYFCVFNIGSNSDAFSWRGALPLVSNVLYWQNSSDTSVSLIASGVLYLPTE